MSALVRKREIQRGPRLDVNPGAGRRIFEDSLDRVPADATVHGRAHVRLEAGEENLSSLGATADRRTAFKNEHSIAGFGEIGSAHETVVPRACDHVDNRHDLQEIEEKETWPGKNMNGQRGFLDSNSSWITLDLTISSVFSIQIAA